MMPWWIHRRSLSTLDWAFVARLVRQAELDEDGCIILHPAFVCCF